MKQKLIGVFALAILLAGLLAPARPDEVQAAPIADEPTPHAYFVELGESNLAGSWGYVSFAVADVCYEGDYLVGLSTERISGGNGDIGFISIRAISGWDGKYGGYRPATYYHGRFGGTFGDPADTEMQNLMQSAGYGSEISNWTQGAVDSLETDPVVEVQYTSADAKLVQSRAFCWGLEGQEPEEEDKRKNLIEDWSFELVWGENEYWYHGQPYTYYPDWWCEIVPGVCEIPTDMLDTIWERYNYNACPWRAVDDPTGIDCFLAPVTNAASELFNGAAKCGDGYQGTDWGSPTVNQDFDWPGGDLNWKVSFRGDYRLFQGPQWGEYGTAYAYITEQSSVEPLYVLVTQQAEDGLWRTAKGTLADVPEGPYRLWLTSPDSYIVEWDDIAISEAPLTDECDIQIAPTATPEMLTNTPQGLPTERPSGTPFVWPSATVTRTDGPTSTASRTPGPTRTLGTPRTLAPTLTPGPPTKTANALWTQYWQSQTAQVGTPTITRTPYGTPQSTYTSVPGTPGNPTNTPAPFPTAGLPPMQPTPWNGTGTPGTGWSPFGTPIPGIGWNPFGTPGTGEGPGLVSCNYECDRPGFLEVAHWIDYGVCEGKHYTCWGAEHNATAVAIFAQFGTYEPFGSMAEIANGVQGARTQIAGAVLENAAAGVNDPISPEAGSILKPGASGDPWAEGAPLVNNLGAPDTSFNGYTPYCSTRLSTLLSSRLAAGVCYVLNLMRKIGYLPWVQFFINVLAILMIVRSAWVLIKGTGAGTRVIEIVQGGLKR